MMVYEWDDAKATHNAEVHGVTFQQATVALEDPDLMYLPDRVVEGEQRLHAVGRVEDIVLLMVAHTMRGDNEETRVRIISARPAERWERKLYRASAGG